ncbi:MAG: EamA family transporter [Gammaproteobacteria bacterium]|nr:EamA family transporter [Gammaproteobacteria bacterium]
MLSPIYAALILIWSTTPLAIQWSSGGVTALFGVTGRMLIGTLLCLVLLIISGDRLPLHRQALQAYAAAAIGLYGSMICVYWGAQFIPSGLVSVLFGLTPVFTALFATLQLQERSGPQQWFGMALGLAGLALLFHQSLSDQRIAADGVLVVLVAVILNALSMVMVKARNQGLSTLALTSGGLSLALPLYLMTWWLLDGNWPADIPTRTWGSILYLGIVGSVIGFMLFFHVLGRARANQVALITLITPLTALWIGHLFNGESLSPLSWLGTMTILSGLVIHQWHIIIRRSAPQPLASTRPED